VDSLEQWVLKYLEHFDGEKHNFKDWGTETGIFDMTTGNLMSWDEAELVKSHARYNSDNDDGDPYVDERTKRARRAKRRVYCWRRFAPRCSLSVLYS